MTDLNNSNGIDNRGNETVLTGLQWTHYPQPPATMDGGDSWEGIGVEKDYRIVGPGGWTRYFSVAPLVRPVYDANGQIVPPSGYPDLYSHYKAGKLKEAQEAAERHYVTG